LILMRLLPELKFSRFPHSIPTTISMLQQSTDEF